MKKRRLAALITSVVLLAAGAGSVYYFKVYRVDSEQALMKTWNAPSLSELSIKVPEDYEEVDSQFFDVSYKKNDAKISLCWDNVDNDIVNYAANAINQYREITDSFAITDEYDADNSGTPVHVVEFNYMLILDDENKFFSCLAAYVMNNGKAYVLTCTSQTSNYSEYRNDFINTYKSMRAVPDLSDTQTGADIITDKSQ